MYFKISVTIGLGLGLGFSFFLSMNGIHRPDLKVSINLGITTLAVEESGTELVAAKCGARLILYILITYYIILLSHHQYTGPCTHSMHMPWSPFSITYMEMENNHGKNLRHAQKAPTSSSRKAFKLGRGVLIR